MDLDELQSVIKLFSQNNITELDYSDGIKKIKLTKEIQNDGLIKQKNGAMSSLDNSEYINIISDLVGVVTFDKSKVAIGKSVVKGDIVANVEVMKMENNITAPVSGIITNIYVSNEDLVEAQQPLFNIRLAKNVKLNEKN